MSVVLGGKPRGFVLTVRPTADETYGLRMEETNGVGHAIGVPVANLGPPASRRIAEQAMDVLQASGFRRSDLSIQRRIPFELPDQHGVRLALAMIATGPLRKRARVDSVLSGVGRLSDEEAFYWYSKCFGSNASRSRRALRLMLADE